MNLLRNRKRRRLRLPEPLPEPDADLLQPVHFDVNQQHPQDQSPLFYKLPAEIRALVFRFALAERESPEHLFPNNSPLRRPGHRGRYRLDVNLLRTCRRVYYEAWFLPFTRAEHTFYFTTQDRRPEHRLSEIQMQHALRIYQARHGFTELNYVAVIAQLWALEPGGMLQDMLKWEHFHPRCVTIVIRHTDWWHWETDDRMYIEPQFANETSFPDSVREIRMELESTLRRQDQVEAMAKAMRRDWRFRRIDGVRLEAVPQPRWTFNWTGNAEWIRARESFASKPSDDLGLQKYFVEVVRYRSARLDAEENKDAQLNNPILDLRPEYQSYSSIRIGPPSKLPVLHRDIGRIDLASSS